MNIAVSLNRKYVRYAYVMLTSLFWNNRDVEINVYALHADLIGEDQELLRQLAQEYGKNIHFLQVRTEDYPAELPVTESWSLETWFRLQLIELLPADVDRILYLDIDIIVDKSLEELYQTDFEGANFCVCKDMGIDGAFPDIRQELFRDILQQGGVYFNAGVMLWNIQALRGRYSLRRYLKLAEDLEYRIFALDQDLLNYMHWNQVKYVDEHRYDCFTRYYHNRGGTYESAKKDVTILHFAGFKPWAGEFVHYDIERIWWDYAKQTPFYHELLEEFLDSSLRSTLVEETLQKSVNDKYQLKKELDNAVALCQKLCDLLPRQGK